MVVVVRVVVFVIFVLIDVLDLVVDFVVFVLGPIVIVSNVGPINLTLKFGTNLVSNR